MGVIVTTTTLEMTDPGQLRPGRALPEGVRIDDITEMTPEFVRWLYGVVGGPWTWVDRLAWSRQQWAEELARPGTEVSVAYAGGAPAGYVHLRAVVTERGDLPGVHVEVLNLGLVEWAIGRGAGGPLLAHGVRAAWGLGARHGLGETSRVWVHTCTLDGPHALANYRARGFSVVDVVTRDEDVPGRPPGAWAATVGGGCA